MFAKCLDNSCFAIATMENNPQPTKLSDPTQYTGKPQPDFKAPLTTPEPATPAPTTPEPATPAPTTPEPATPAPTTPEPATPAPTTPKPTPTPTVTAPESSTAAPPTQSVTLPPSPSENPCKYIYIYTYTCTYISQSIYYNQNMAFD